jgi:hypothetical protein
MWREDGEFDGAATHVSFAEWFEVIRAESHEIRGIHSTRLSPNPDSATAPPAWKDPVMFLEVECLKQARRQAYIRPIDKYE